MFEYRNAESSTLSQEGTGLLQQVGGRLLWQGPFAKYNQTLLYSSTC